MLHAKVARPNRSDVFHSSRWASPLPWSSPSQESQHRPSSPLNRRSEPDVQLVQPSGPGQATPPTTVTLQDALERARKLDPTLWARPPMQKAPARTACRPETPCCPRLPGLAISEHTGKWNHSRRKIRDERRNTRLSRVGSPASGPFARGPHGNGAYSRQSSGGYGQRKD